MRFAGPLVFALLTSAAHARVQRDVISVAGGGGAPVRWTLADWLAKENGPSLATSFLAFNRNQRFFEVNAGATQGSFKLKDPNASAGTRLGETQQTYTLDLYASILNLHGELERTSAKRDTESVAAGLRLLGTGTRTTGVIARYGLSTTRDRRVDPPTESRRRYAEAQVQLYLWSWFGLDGAYRQYQPRGERHQAGVFFELARFRVFGTYQRETAGVTVREGFDGGVKFFF